MAIPVTEQRLTDGQPDVDKEVLPGHGEALAEFGHVGAFSLTRASPLLGELISLDVAIDIALQPALVAELFKSFPVYGIIEMGGYPFDAKEAVR